MTEIGRREALAAGGAVLVGATLLNQQSDDQSAGLVAGFESEANLRIRRLRPSPGGVAITAETVDGYGTLAGGLEGPAGETAALTCRHVVDPAYPDGDESDVIGTAVYQPTDDSSPIGTVIDVGESKGSGSTDWALIEIEDASKWTSRVLGLGAPTARGEPAIGDRIVTSGTTTGLLGAEITDVSVGRNWRGTLVEDLIEYRVDEGLDTAGNSGSWIGTLDPDTGGFRPVGIHAFRIDDSRYAVPIEQAVDEPGAVLSSDGEQPATPDVGSFVEGAIEYVGADVGTVVVSNIGGEAVSGREIAMRDAESGETIDTTTVDLEPLERAVLDLGVPADADPVLDTGDVEIEAS